MMLCSPELTQDSAVIFDLDQFGPNTEGEVVTRLWPQAKSLLKAGAPLILFSSRTACWAMEHVVWPLVSFLDRTFPPTRLFLVSEGGSLVERMTFKDADHITVETKYVFSLRVPAQDTIVASLEQACVNGQLFGRIREDARYSVSFELDRPFPFDPCRLLGWVPSEVRQIHAERGFGFVHADACKENALQALVDRAPELAGKPIRECQLSEESLADNRIACELVAPFPPRRPLGFDDPELFPFPLNLMPDIDPGAFQEFVHRRLGWLR